MQLRILTTALLMIVLLKKVFSAVQWGAMCVALIGVALVQLSGHKHPAAESETKYIGIVSVLVMCWTSAFAGTCLTGNTRYTLRSGVYLEGVLKKSSCDIWLQNIRLSVITLPFSIMTMANDLPVLRDSRLDRIINATNDRVQMGFSTGGRSLYGSSLSRARQTGSSLQL